MASSSPESERRPARRSLTDDDVGEPSAKKLRSADGSAIPGSAPRRQAACQQCRLRKVKCDKKRPTCSICRSCGQDCEYLGEPSEKITLESATATLLERFDQLQREFEDVKQALNNKPDTSVPYSVHHHQAHHQQAHRQHEPPPERPRTPVSTASLEPSRDFLRIPPHRASADTVLLWEIFEDKYPVDSLIGDLFHPTDDGLSPDIIVPPGGITPLDDEQIPTLIDRFLQNVHTKNPILDVEALVKHGRRCADQGVGWDGRSCLVLMACALGAVAKPFDRALQTRSVFADASEASGRGSTASSARVHAKELQQGDSCFTLACRRLGSLKYSMLGAQCHFFAGVYLMYTLRPILSWHYFLHASIFCQVHLRMTHGISGDFTEVLSAPSRHTTSKDRKFRRLEQSLYWSCFKSECEFRVELPLAQSEISLGEYPDLFPSPPSPMSTQEAIVLASRPPDQISPPTNTANINPLATYDSSSMMSEEAIELRQHAVRLCNEEESWYYYLTEIALRRIGNRIINTFFRQERFSWINIRPLLHMAQEFEAQVSSWSAHLPPAMQHYETTSIIRAPHLSFLSEGPGNHVSQELSWAIDNRLLEMQTWLYQPFLYYLIHAGYPSSHSSATGHPSQISRLLNPHSPDIRSSHPGVTTLDKEDLAILHSLIVSGIKCSIKTIDVRARYHRHHGLWYDLRSIMGAALILLAIVKSGNADWIPGGTEGLWGTATSTNYWVGTTAPIGGRIAKVLAQFDFWAAESPDMLRYRDILESVVRDVRGS